MVQLKRVFSIIVFSVTFFFLISCKANNNNDFDIVTTLYPHYDIASEIAQDNLSVNLLTPIGSEIHGFSPTAKDIISIKNAKLFIYTSNELEPWVNNLLSSSDSNIVNLSNEYKGEDLNDLHYWTDPFIFLELINVIRDEIIKIDPDNANIYHNNANNYYERLLNIHSNIDDYFESSNNKTIYFFGHNALDLFANRYNIDIQSLSDSYQPDAQLTPQQIIILKNNIRENNAKYLFVEELVDLSSVNTLKNELEKEGYPLTILELHGYHNVSYNDFKEGINYGDLLERNFKNLKLALND